MLLSYGASTLATSISVLHSRSVLVVGVTRLHSAMRVKRSALKTVARDPVPERHINFFSRWSKVPPAFLKLWRTRSFLLECAAKKTMSGSAVNI